MALRRLFSGWLIAVAALARSVASALERAAADPAEPAPAAPAPVMAALAQRYPGAPDHWLTLVAERTAQMAETGAAPMSVSSRPSAWPESLPGAVAPLEPLSPTASSDEPAPRPVVRERSDAVPSLAALQDRPSEVWRRPETSRARRPRPVFAPVEPSSGRGAFTLGAAPAERRPRSPLKLEDRAPIDVVSTGDSAGDRSGTETVTTSRELIEQEAVAPPKPAPDFTMARESVDRSEPPSRLSNPPAVESIGEASPRPALADLDRPTPLDTQADPPPSRRPAAPGAIFQALAALGGKASRPQTTSHPAASKAAAAQAPQEAGGDTATARSEPSFPDPFPRATSAPEWPRLEADAPPPAARPRADAASASRPLRPSWPPPLLEVANDLEPQPRFVFPTSSSAKAQTPQAVRPSADTRWPEFPPAAFAPPVTAVIPSPRLDELAREQEEGRWSV